MENFFIENEVQFITLEDDILKIVCWDKGNDYEITVNQDGDITGEVKAVHQFLRDNQDVLDRILEIRKNVSSLDEYGDKEYHEYSDNNL